MIPSFITILRVFWGLGTWLESFKTLEHRLDTTGSGNNLFIHSKNTAWLVWSSPSSSGISGWHSSWNACWTLHEPGTTSKHIRLLELLTGWYGSLALRFLELYLEVTSVLAYQTDHCTTEYHSGSLVGYSGSLLEHLEATEGPAYTVHHSHTFQSLAMSPGNNTGQKYYRLDSIHQHFCNWYMAREVRETLGCNLADHNVPGPLQCDNIGCVV